MPIAMLEGLRVIDATTAYASFCGLLLADLGAVVVKVELPGGELQLYFANETPYPGANTDQEIGMLHSLDHGASWDILPIESSRRVSFFWPDISSWRGATERSPTRKQGLSHTPCLRVGFRVVRLMRKLQWG